jgi:hypothetical protein
MTRPPPSPVHRVAAQIERLYHLAEADNLPSILTHGLMSTERLADAAGVDETQRSRLLYQHRPANVRLSPDILIRNQRPMPPKALAGALDDDLTPADWYRLLNGFVFLWPDRGRLERQRQACASDPQVLLTFDAKALLEEFGAEAFVSPINSGNARRKPARRGRGTIIPYQTWLEEGWPTGQRTRPPAEFLFRTVIPVQAPYLIDSAAI